MKKEKALLKLLSNPRVITGYYSPSISRSFTESMSEACHQAARIIPARIAVPWPVLLNEWLVVGFASGILLYLNIALGFQIKTQLTEVANQRAMQTAIVSEIEYWQKMTQKYGQFRDGYFRLALLQYQLGDIQLAETYVDKALAVDPNFVAGLTLKETLAGE